MLEVYLMLRNLVLALWHRNCKVRRRADVREDAVNGEKCEYD